MHAGGRPKKIIDYNLVEKLASIMCTVEEIAEIIGCNKRTLERDAEFCRIYKSGQDKGKASIRRQQFKLLNAGNATMAVWLGKQYLGQKDQMENKVDVSQQLQLVVDEDDLHP